MPKLSSLPHLVAAGAVLAMLGGCANPRNAEITGSVPAEYQKRHPIQVARGVSTIDLLPGGGPAGLTDRQVADIQGFAAEWRARGRGKITVQVPVGADAATDTQSAFAAKEIRRILAASGIVGPAVSTERYPADGPGHLAPVRLEFPILQAKLPHECGQWPEDLGVSDGAVSVQNRQHWNFGCASQQNLAAQVADPEDFIRPRAEDGVYAARRSTVVQKYRKGESTATTYPKDNVETQD